MPQPEGAQVTSLSHEEAIELRMAYQKRYALAAAFATGQPYTRMETRGEGADGVIITHPPIPLGDPNGDIPAAEDVIRAERELQAVLDRLSDKVD